MADLICRRSAPLAAWLCLAAVVAACDERFEPVVPSARAFSVFGYLDASADTQWIRVMPLRPVRVTSRGAFDATVTLEQLGTGRLITLRDSLFQFARPLDPDVGSEGTFAHNFWTTDAIEPGTAYRFSASHAGTEPAQAVVAVPRHYAVEVAINQAPLSLPPDELRITGVTHVPFFTTIARFHDDCGPGATKSLNERSSAEDGVHVFAVGRTGAVPRDECGQPRVDNWEFWIVGSEDAWPTEGYAPDALGGSSITSNVTNAVGFLGGVLIRTIPYEACVFSNDGTQVPQYCRLRYAPETATLTGTVRDGGCGGAALQSVTVRLTELDRSPARIRTAITTRGGEFLISALEPGIPHLLLALAPASVVNGVPVEVYRPYTDTLPFVPGQQLAYDIQLQRLIPCSQLPAAP